MILMLAPAPPLLFMGEEFGAETPFLFFSDFEKALAAAVTAGRREEFSRLPAFRDSDQRESIPDPNAAATFEASQLDWSSLAHPDHEEWLSFYRQLLATRHEHIVARLAGACFLEADYQLHEDHGITAHWRFREGSQLTLLANLGAAVLPGFAVPEAQLIYASTGINDDSLRQGTLPGWSVAWFLES